MLEQDKKLDASFSYINRRYAAALLATATLLLFSQVLIQLTIYNMKSDAREVNISGRQRMLSQKITKCVLGLLAVEDPVERHEYSHELAYARNLWQKSHEALRYGSAEMDLPSRNSEAVEALYTQMEPHYQAIIRAVDVILLSGADMADKEVLASYARSIRENEREFLSYMDKIVFQYDTESNIKLRHLQILEFTILAVALVVLAFEWRVVFKPAQREIKAGFEVMKKNEEYLNQLFETTPTLTILFDAESLKVVKYNAMTVQMLKDWLNIDITKETQFADIMPGLDNNLDLSKRVLEKIREEKEFSNLEVGIAPGKIVLMSVKTIESGGRELYLLGLSDITTLKQAATFDSMTAMLNRRAGLELLGFLFDEGARTGMPLAICFIDIDRLKMVNDEYGHQEGDWYIKNVAQCLNLVLSGKYKGIRYGGDELIVVTENPDLAEFQTKMEKVDEMLHRVGRDNFKPYRMSVSHGFAVYPSQSAACLNDLIEEADFNMYEHKKAKKAQRILEGAECVGLPS